MKNVFYFLNLLLLSFVIISCHRYKNSRANVKLYEKYISEPLCTVKITNMDCTGCLDAYLDSGKILVPKELSIIFGDTLTKKDILLIGKFPFEAIDHGSLLFQSDISGFRLKGKLVGIDTFNKVMRNAPIFYVESWEIIR